MALPAGIKLVDVNVGPAKDFLGEVIAGAQVSITPSRPLVWAATGTPMFPRPMKFTFDPASGDSLPLKLPATDQPGFQDGEGNEVTNWYYNVAWTFSDRGFATPPVHAVNLPFTTTPIDLDLIFPLNGDSTAYTPVPMVRSVNGMTGDVTIEAITGLDLVDNTRDLDKPISRATQSALDLKASKTDLSNGLSSKADADVVNTALLGKADNAAVSQALGTKADLVGGKVPPAQLSITAGEKVKVIAAAGTALQLDKPDVASSFDVQLNQPSCAISAPSGFSDGAAITLLLRQDGTGGRAITFATPISWLGDGVQPSLKTTPGAVTIITLFTFNGGATWFGTSTVTTLVAGHHASHEPGGSDAIDLSTVNRMGTVAQRPAASAALKGVLYAATDALGGTVYRCNGTGWDRLTYGLRAALVPTAYKAVSFERIGATVTSRNTLTSGKPYVVAIPVNEGDVISSISFWAGSTGGASLTNQWFALFDSASNKLGVTADAGAAAWGANKEKVLTLTAPVTITASGFVYAVAVVAGTTPPNMLAVQSSGFLAALPPILAGTTAHTGLTDPSTCPATLGALTVSGDQAYAGLA